MAEVACDMANLDRHLARHLGHLFCDLFVDWGGSSRNLDETQATPRFCSPIVRFCIQLRKPVKNRKSKPVKKSCTNERTRPLSLSSFLFVVLFYFLGNDAGLLKMKPLSVALRMASVFDSQKLISRPKYLWQKYAALSFQQISHNKRPLKIASCPRTGRCCARIGGPR